MYIDGSDDKVSTDLLMVLHKNVKYRNLLNIIGEWASNTDCHKDDCPFKKEKTKSPLLMFRTSMCSCGLTQLILDFLAYSTSLVENEDE